MYKILPPFIILIFVGLLTACADIPLQKLKYPEVSVAGFKPVKFEQHEQKYQLQLRLKNPNFFPLPISGVNYRLFFNDKEFINGAPQQSTTIPANGEGPLDIEIVTNLMDIIKDLPDWKKILKDRQLGYRVEGAVHLKAQQFKIPFKHQGEISLEEYGNIFSNPLIFQKFIP
jgi:LEA14-like dessication related protein